MIPVREIVVNSGCAMVKPGNVSTMARVATHKQIARMVALPVSALGFATMIHSNALGNLAEVPDIKAKQIVICNVQPKQLYFASTNVLT
jgi:hypothetical protein